MAERKKFINVEIPILDKIVQALGTPKDLHNKTIKMDLSKRLRGKGLVMTLQIVNDHEKLIAYPKKLELTKSYIRRIIRTKSDNVEDSFQANAKDIKVTIKPFLITRKKVSRVVRKNLRNTTREFLMNYAKERSYLEMCEDILDNNLQRDLLPKLKKIYPLAFCDLRIFEIKDLSKVNLTMKRETPIHEEKGVETEEDKTQADEIAEEEEKKDSDKIEEEKPKKKVTKKSTKKEKVGEENAEQE